MMRLDLGPLKMNTGTPDANGALWYVTDWQGWDAPNLRQSFGDMTGRHGTNVQESMLSNRAMVVTGICKARGEDGYWAAYNDLLGLTNNLIHPINLVAYETVPKRLGVIRGGSPKLDPPMGSHFSFELNLIAMDPLKYAMTPTVVTIAAGATAVINTKGSFQTWPVITSSAINLKLTRVESGQTFQMTGGWKGIKEADTLKRTAQITRISDNPPGLIMGVWEGYPWIATSSVWWALQPGKNTVKNSGNGPATLTFYDAWI